MKGSHPRPVDRCPFVLGHSISQVTSFMQLGMLWILMTWPNGNIFLITGPLCGEFTGRQWIPLIKARAFLFGCFGSHKLFYSLWRYLSRNYLCTDLDKSSWTFFLGAYFTLLCCTKTYHNLTRYFTTTLVLMFWMSQAYAIASCISAHFCDVAYAL